MTSKPKPSMVVSHPELAEELHPTLNGDYNPNNIIAGTDKKLLWICKTISKTPCGHIWTARGFKRLNGHNCNSCSNRQIHLDGRNSIRTTHPELAKEFIAEKNKPFTIDNLTAGSHKKIHWRCSVCKYEWRAVVYSRKSGKSCPRCNVAGFNMSDAGYLYVMKYTSALDEWYKCGITNNHPEIRRNHLETRISKTKLYFDASVSIVEHVFFRIGSDAWDLEKKLLDLSEIRFYSNEKFEGHSELFTINPLFYINTIEQ